MKTFFFPYQRLLKEYERLIMAVYTDISTESLEEFLQRYDLGKLLSFKGIAEGVENSNYFVKTEINSYILTLYEKRVNASELPFFINLMEYLSSQGLNCPLPIRDKKNIALAELSGKPAALVSFLEGLSVKRASPAHCYALGKVLAELHKAGKNFNMKRENSLSVRNWRPLLNASGEKTNSVADGLYIYLQQELDILEKEWPSDLPSGVIHADLFPDNVFFINEKVSGVIDFYFACTDFFAYDLAICLNAWCFEADSSYNLTKGEALFSGYQSIRPLINDEKKNFSLLCRGSAIRFALTRLYDWLNVPEGALVRPKNPMEYKRKLAFHQRILSYSEYGL